MLSSNFGEPIRPVLGVLSSVIAGYRNESADPLCERDAADPISSARPADDAARRDPNPLVGVFGSYGDTVTWNANPPAWVRVLKLRAARARPPAFLLGLHGALERALLL
jgi:hypothetical protein